MPAKLTVVGGPKRGTELPLDGKAVFDIGASPGPAGFTLEGAGVAATHIRIFREDDKFTPDEEGEELAGIEAAQHEATQAALSIGSERRSEERRELSIEVRDGAGHIILDARLSLAIESFDFGR